MRIPFLACLVGGVFVAVVAAQGADPTVVQLRGRAETGDPKARHELGSLYLSGGQVAQDFVEAARWFRTAAERDHAASQFSLGELYFNGQP